MEVISAEALVLIYNILEAWRCSSKSLASGSIRVKVGVKIGVAHRR